jgi:hypothetical protein
MNAPAYFFEIVCLANSRKHSGRCVAGQIIGGPRSGTWVRPVSARRAAQISAAESRLANGAWLEVQDVVRCPSPSQPSTRISRKIM